VRVALHAERLLKGRHGSAQTVELESIRLVRMQPPPFQVTNSTIWLILVGIAIVGTYAAVLIPALAGKETDSTGILAASFGPDFSFPSVEAQRQNTVDRRGNRRSYRICR